ncbi:unannotated protein [freshwater metagenome]|uniref:Unannotated protein n=1 Tax=freshwater metagenome TaxID=449393 RepID=A0A6J6LKK3_9ZZZZ
MTVTRKNTGVPFVNPVTVVESDDDVSVDPTVVHVVMFAERSTRYPVTLTTPTGVGQVSVAVVSPAEPSIVIGAATNGVPVTATDTAPVPPAVIAATRNE